MSILDDLKELTTKQVQPGREMVSSIGLLTISNAVMQTYIYKFGLDKSLIDRPVLERDEILKGYEL